MEIKFDVEGVERTIDILRKTEPEALKSLKEEIATDSSLVAVSSSIKSQIPPVAPLSGFMSHSGRTSYAIPEVKPELNSRKLRLGRNEQSLVTITTSTPRNAVGFEIIDMAGRGQGARSTKGAKMIQNLAGSPSRYVYKGFEKRKDNLTNGVKKILESYAEKVNVKLRSF